MAGLFDSPIESFRSLHVFFLTLNVNITLLVDSRLLCWITWTESNTTAAAAFSSHIFATLDRRSSQDLRTFIRSCRRRGSYSFTNCTNDPALADDWYHRDNLILVRAYSPLPPTRMLGRLVVGSPFASIISPFSLWKAVPR